MKLYTILRLNLKKKLALIFSVVIILPFIIMAFLVLPSQIETQYVDSSSQQIVLIDNNIDIFFSQIMRNVDFMIPTELLEEAIGNLTSYVNQGEDTPRIIKSRTAGGLEQKVFDVFDRYRNTHPYVTYIYFGLETGEYLQAPDTGQMAPNYDPRQRPFYKTGISGNGNFMISEPSIHDNNLFVSIVKSISNNNKLLGVIGIDINLRSITEMLENMKVGKKGYIILVHDSGKIISHATNSEYNTQKIEDVNITGLQNIDNIKNKVIKTKYNNEKYLTNIYTSPKTNWKIIAMIPQQEINATIFIMSIFILIIALITLFVGLIISFKFIDTIQIPLTRFSKRIEQLSKGDLKSEVFVSTSNDEVGVLGQSLKLTIETLNNYIVEINNVLYNIANGDLTTIVKQEYVGDFAPIKISLQAITNSLNNTFLQIHQSSDQVASGAYQMSSGAQALAEGATEQAISIEQLSTSIENISRQLEQTSNNSNEANNLSASSKSVISTNSMQMQKMITAISEISETSNQIRNIIKTIEDVASQTNLLALNAAIEAARAGEAGNGFAVVADEVRNLANKSTIALKDTTALIEKSIKAVENGTNIANETAKSLNGIIYAADTTIKFVSEIAQASNQQTNSISEISLGIKNISSVVETNSAMAEENSAASEELAQQANCMQELVGKFKLKREI